MWERTGYYCGKMRQRIITDFLGAVSRKVSYGEVICKSKENATISAALDS
jgi:hypothetical protein